MWGADNIREMDNRNRPPGLSEAAPQFLREPRGKSYASETLGQRIRRMRKQAKLTQIQLATLLNTAQSSISRWEGDEDEPNPAYMAALAQAFDTTEAELHYGPEGEPAKAPEIQTVPVVGYVGAGDKVYPIDDHPMGQGFEEVEVPFTIGKPLVAVRVRGDSMRPMLHDNWLLIYTRDHDGVVDDCMNKLCIVKVSDDGPTLIKEVRRGPKRGRFNLLSTNASPIEDVALDWAARVLFIQPS